MSQRTPGLIAIICYKFFTAILFLLSAISIFLTLKHRQELQQFADSLELASKQGIIAWGVNKILNLNPKTLQFGGVVTAVYAVVTIIEAVGLWLKKAWARWLVIGVVGISIPPEIYELIKGFSLLKLLAFIINIGIFIYLLREVPNDRKAHQ
ncbi:MAG: DUF2127 domain-containing protein [Brasilonema angustatum HA4187-MV1]|jgi:uncharacterized membrane protein (DUF2068 family)|nr:DUF2127 domain-containing protein [Brasilonema angustatum HA4187-MV1]